jgi:hypothetical protein
MHRVQTYAFTATPSRMIRMRWRFGSKRRFVATIEWLRLLPKDGARPQMEQTRDTRAVWATARIAANGTRPLISPE